MPTVCQELLQAVDLKLGPIGYSLLQTFSLLLASVKRFLS